MIKNNTGIGTAFLESSWVVVMREGWANQIGRIVSRLGADHVAVEWVDLIGGGFCWTEIASFSDMRGWRFFYDDKECRRSPEQQAADYFNAKKMNTTPMQPQAKEDETYGGLL